MASHCVQSKLTQISPSQIPNSIRRIQHDVVLLPERVVFHGAVPMTGWRALAGKIHIIVNGRRLCPIPATLSGAIFTLGH